MLVTAKAVAYSSWDLYTNRMWTKVSLHVCFHLQQRDSSRGRHREKEDIKITKERTPASEEEPTEWETNREGSKTILLALFSIS